VTAVLYDVTLHSRVEICQCLVSMFSSLREYQIVKIKQEK